MKMIISARRNPAMTRRQFHHHLRHVHWPLIQSLPAVEQALGGYVQNHALGPESPETSNNPLRVATERDSVIELYFANEAGLGHLATLPEYMAQVRPDEAHFNDLPHNVMVKVVPQTLFEAAQVGRCKRFDFLVRAEGVDATAFVDRVRSAAADCALDPLYTAQIDRLVLNSVGAGSDGGGFGTGTFDCVVESWASNFAALAGAGSTPTRLDDVGLARSFTVYATEFVMISPPTQV